MALLGRHHDRSGAAVALHTGVKDSQEGRLYFSLVIQHLQYRAVREVIFDCHFVGASLQQLAWYLRFRLQGEW